MRQKHSSQMERASYPTTITEDFTIRLSPRCFLPLAGTCPIVSKDKPLQSDKAIPGTRKALDQVGAARKGFRPGADDGKLFGIEDELGACETTPETYGPGWAHLVLRWGGRGFHFNRFFAFRDTKRQDADSTAPLGSDTNRPSLDFLSDDFLDFGQVSFGFEVTPAGFLCGVSHQIVLSAGG